MPELEGLHSARTPLRLVVLGAGPKALFALEALTFRLQIAHSAPASGRGGAEEPRLEVTVIDPAEHPGAGAAYALDQSPVLRLNVAARILGAPIGGAFPSFPDWIAEAVPSLAAEPYPPRAVVGRYLSHRWQQMFAALGRHAHCTHLRGRAVAVERDGAHWRVTVAAASSEASDLNVPDLNVPGLNLPGAGVTAAGATGSDVKRSGTPHLGTHNSGTPTSGTLSAGMPSPSAYLVPLGPVDEVLVATGHGAGHDGALENGWAAALPLCPTVLPVATMLTPARVPPGARVLVRGAALTFLDAALALTEGRGATFAIDPEHPDRLLHRRSPQEPATLLPTTRHGLLLDAKPDPGTRLAAPVSPALIQSARRLAALDPRDPAVAEQALGILIEAAASLLSGGQATCETLHRNVERTLATGAEPDLGTGAGRAERALRRSVAVAQGQRRPGPAWALGRAWSRLYPQFTELLRGNDLPQNRWQELRESAQVLERFAFGPPLLTAQKLLAMVDAGAVDLCFVDAGTTITTQGPHGIPPGVMGVDLVIDAVLPPPGVQTLIDPLPRQLLRVGLISVRPGRRGAVVQPDGTAITAAGDPAEGLALIGRPTEDHVIGHDTLDRHLHGEITQWAARLAARTEPTRTDGEIR